MKSTGNDTLKRSLQDLYKQQQQTKRKTKTTTTPIVKQQQQKIQISIGGNLVYVYLTAFRCHHKKKYNIYYLTSSWI